MGYATCSRRPVFGYLVMVLSMIATAFIGFGVWVHHMFATGLPQLGQSFFTAASIMIVVPTALQIFGWIATVWTARRLAITVPFLYAASFFCLLRRSRSRSTFVRFLEFRQLDVRRDTNAYGSVTWFLLGLHTLHFLTDFLDSTVRAAVMFCGRLVENRFVDVSENAMYSNSVVRLVAGDLCRHLPAASRRLRGPNRFWHPELSRLAIIGHRLRETAGPGDGPARRQARSSLQDARASTWPLLTAIATSVMFIWSIFQASGLISNSPTC